MTIYNCKKDVDITDETNPELTEQIKRTEDTLNKTVELIKTVIK